VIGDDVALVLLVSLSTALTLPSFFAPLEKQSKQLPSPGSIPLLTSTELGTGKLALWFRMVILPWVAAVSWVISGFFVATIETVGGFPLFYVSWFFWVVAVVLPIYSMVQLVLWEDFNA
jgi:hypothetical protein